MSAEIHPQHKEEEDQHQQQQHKEEEEQVCSCLDRLKWELGSSYPLFSLQEPPPHGRWLHVSSCFAPPCSVLRRGIFLLLGLHVFFYDIYHYPPHNYYIYMGYLTHWGHALSNVYFLVAFFVAIRFSYQQPQQSPHDYYSPPSCLLKLMWGLYDTVTPLEVAITLLYWGSGLYSDAFLTYVNVMEHGGLLVLLVWDGWTIPVRAKHIVFLLSISLLYLVWTILDAILDIGSGDWGPAYNDDALYPILNWKKETRGAAIVSAFAVSILAPLIYTIMWMWSLQCAWDGSRRPLLYYPQQRDDTEMYDYYKGLDNKSEMA